MTQYGAHHSHSYYGNSGGVFLKVCRTLQNNLHCFTNELGVVRARNSTHSIGIFHRLAVGILTRQLSAFIPAHIHGEAAYTSCSSLPSNPEITVATCTCAPFPLRRCCLHPQSGNSLQKPREKLCAFLRRPSGAFSPKCQKFFFCRECSYPWLHIRGGFRFTLKRGTMTDEY